MSKEVRIFTYEPFREAISPDLLNSIKSKFKAYKTTGIPDETFGRDTTFDFPSQVALSGLKHIHIKDKTSRRWALHKFAFDKTSDTALIYCSGFFDENCYLLIGLIENAHAVYKENLLYLLELSDVANRFRNKF